MSPKQMLKGKGWTGYSDGEEGRLPAQTQDQADSSSCCASAPSPPASTSTTPLPSKGQKEFQAKSSKKTKKSKSDGQDTQEHYVNGDVADLAKQPHGAFGVPAAHPPSPQQWPDWWPDLWRQQQEQQWQQWLDWWWQQLEQQSRDWWQQNQRNTPARKKRQQKQSNVESNKCHSGDTPDDSEEALSHIRIRITIDNLSWEFDGQAMVRGHNMLRKMKQGEINQTGRSTQDSNHWCSENVAMDFMHCLQSLSDGNLVLGCKCCRLHDGQVFVRALEAVLLDKQNTKEGHEMVGSILAHHGCFLIYDYNFLLTLAAKLAPTEQMAPFVGPMVEQSLTNELMGRVACKATENPNSPEKGLSMAEEVFSRYQREPASVVLQRDPMRILENTTKFVVDTAMTLTKKAAAVKTASEKMATATVAAEVSLSSVGTSSTETAEPTKICWADLVDSDGEEESPPPAQKAAGEKKVHEELLVLWNKYLELFTRLSDGELYQMVVEEEQLKAITNLLKGENSDCKSQLKKRLIRHCNCLPKLWEKVERGSIPFCGVPKKAFDLIGVLLQ